MSGPVKVLVVDDDQAIRGMLALALGQAGYDVSLSDGSDLSTAERVDVVLLDHRLGRRTAADLLVEAPWIAEVPMVLVTAALDARTAASGMPRPAAIIGKPFDLDELEAAIEGALPARKRRRRRSDS